MEKIIAFQPEEPDVAAMDKAQLISYREELEAQIAALDQKEPRNQNSEAYEDWADRHEDLEDLLDEVLDRLDDFN